MFNHTKAAQICHAITFGDDDSIKGLLMHADISYVMHEKRYTENAEIMEVQYGDYIVYCIRGTNDLKDWKNNLDFTIIGQFHAGFHQHYRDSNIANFVIQNAGKKVYFVGHSLGGAVAQIAAFNLRSKVSNIAEVVTFGSPKVFSAESDYVYPFELTQYERAGDPVPHLLKRKFKHKGNRIWFDHNHKLVERPKFYHRINSWIRERFFRHRNVAQSHNVYQYMRAMEAQV